MKLGNSLPSSSQVIIILVLALTITNITYSYYYQRRREFSILSALGYTTKDILKKVLAEIVVINFLSFIVGVVLSLVGGYLLNSFIFISLGERLYLWKPSFLLVASLIPVIRLVTRIDKIEIIEGID